MKKFIRIGIMVVIALLFIGTFVFLYQKSQPKDVEYNVLKVVKSNIVQTTVATGKIEPRDEVQIKPQISGIISEVYKEAGETVKKGDDGTVYKLHIFNDSTFVCGMNPETVSVPHSLMITTDSGRTWNEIGVPGKFVDSSIKITYSENCLFASLYGAEYEHALFVKNVITGQERVFEFRRDLHSIVASEGIFTTHPEMRFWQFDGETMKPISVFQWNPDWGYGSYYPRHLFRRGELVIGMAEQFPGKEGKRRCVFGSTDGGCHWEPFVTGDDISIIMAQIGDTAAEVSSDNSISVFFLRNGRINVLTLKKMYSEKTERKNSGNQEKEVFDLLFGKLTDYYEENVPGFSLPEINGESIVD